MHYQFRHMSQGQSCHAISYNSKSKRAIIFLEKYLVYQIIHISLSNLHIMREIMYLLNE